jgi:hypothetical protein
VLAKEVLLGEVSLAPFLVIEPHARKDRGQFVQGRVALLFQCNTLESFGIHHGGFLRMPLRQELSLSAVFRGDGFGVLHTLRHNGSPCMEFFARKGMDRSKGTEYATLAKPEQSTTNGLFIDELCLSQLMPRGSFNLGEVKPSASRLIDKLTTLLLPAVEGLDAAQELVGDVLEPSSLVV